MADESLITAPRVSVIIPAYNAAEFIVETLDSVFAQTFSDFEVIVVNDGSPDTEALERKLKPYPAKLRYLKQENQGAAAARNTGIRAASGEFVAFLDADDTWLPIFLEKQLELLQRTRADFVFADALLTGNSPLAGRTFMDVQPSRGEVTAASLLLVQVTILTSTVLARKEPIIEVGLFDVTLRRGHDFELWLRLAKRNIHFAYQRLIVAHHRILESGLSGGTISQLERTLSVLDKIRTRDDLSEKEKAALQLNVNRTRAELALEEGKDQLLSRNFEAAAGAFRQARELGGGWKLQLVCAAMQLAPDLLRRVYQARVSRRQTAEV